MRFSKMHGAGNDFVVIDLRDGRPPPDVPACRRIADRHRGVGCDQILTIGPSRDPRAVAAYRIWNSDGSVSGQCGNGARCIAAWLVRDGAAPAEGGFMIESDGGLHAVARDAAGHFVIDMGAPRFSPDAVPLRGWGDEADAYLADVDGQRLRFGAVSMGNPHAVLEVAELDAADVTGIGRALQRHPGFPESVNVGVAQVLSPTHLRLRVFERGAGETLACGSGACAAVAVLARQGRIDPGAEVHVDLPGGRLRIRQDGGSGHLLMGGPAAFVFEGEWRDQAV